MPVLGRGAGYDSLSIHAEFTYLPEKRMMTVTVTADSTVVVHKDSSDSVICTVRKANPDSVRQLFDSALAGFTAVGPGEYKKDQVIDGTRIRIRHRGMEVFCDNCLNDFILEAVGVPMPTPSGIELKLRALVSLLSELAVLAEGKPKVKQKVLELIVDKKAMRDTTRGYELGNTQQTAR